MFARTYIAFCKNCGETTPHEDQRIGRWISIALGIAGIVFVLCFGDLWSWIWMAGLLYAGAWFSLDRHERHSNERCTRCRHKARWSWRRTQPDPRNSTIDI